MPEMKGGYQNNPCAAVGRATGPNRLLPREPHNKHFDSLLIRGLLHPWGFPQLRKAEQYSRNSSQGVKLHPYSFAGHDSPHPGYTSVQSYTLTWAF
jgi:hypothetical protein